MADNHRNELTGPRVSIVVYNNLCVFEFGIATEVFSLPRPEFDQDWYQCQVVSAEGPVLKSFGGVSLAVEKDLTALKGSGIVILPGWRPPYSNVPTQLINALNEAYDDGARIVAICGGAYVLAATGLLRGKKATTHWRLLHHFVNEYPDIDLENAPLYCEQDRLFTSAGSAAGIDLCLHVVQQDYGIEKANVVANRLVVSPLRSGTQNQNTTRSILPQKKHHKLQAVLEELRGDLSRQLTIEKVARQAGLTPRTFMRQFQRITGTTFSDWMRAQRIERAKTLLSETDLSIELIAEACGYASSSSLRRILRQEMGKSPKSLRQNVQ